MQAPIAAAAPVWLWGPLAAVGLLWPGRMAGPFDGVPLDGTAEAVVVGAVFPALWWFHPRFLESRLARGCVIALLGWKALTAVALVQDGWCVTFTPSAPLVKDGAGAPHSWDARADWRSAHPSCSAVMTRSYNQLSEFPAWFFNLPPPNDNMPAATDRPPGAVVTMTVGGFLRARRSGLLQIVTGPDVAAAVLVDGRPVSSGEAAHSGVTLAPGVHTIAVNAMLTGDRWQLVPLWNGADLWPGSTATLQKPSRLDLAVRPWGRWVATALVVVLMLAWLASAAARVRSPDVLAWTIGASVVLGVLAETGRVDWLGWAVAALAGAVFLPIPARLRNVFGAFALLGIPWLTTIVVSSAPAIGRFTLYTAGDDYWMFQRYAYRIFMQGYWLEGGQPTFWFQPLYRWIAGALHLVFGDSSVGEWYWDGACLLAMALFSFHVTKAFAGFRWGIVAAATTLAVVVSGPGWVFIGRGLSEISSAGLVSLAAFFALRGRRRRWRSAIAAGVLATLAFYTRLNNLPMAFAVAAFALPVRRPIRTAFQPSAWLSRASLRTLAIVIATLGLGLLAFAWRTWHYTGVFSLFYGTQRSSLAVYQQGMSLWTLLNRMAGSVMMVLTMNDPPRFDPMAIPLMLGFAMAVLAAARVVRLRDLPSGLVLFCLAAVSGSLIARGTAYPGRFSIHLIGVTSAVLTCAAAVIVTPGSVHSRDARLKPRATCCVD